MVARASESTRILDWMVRGSARFFTRVFDTVRKYFFRDESLPYIPFDRSEKYKRSGLNSRLKAI